MNGRRTRKQQIMTMSIIAVAIITLSIGFAAFSSTLRISSTAAVNPDSGNFSVVFSSNANTLETNPVAANPSTYGDPAEIVNGTVPTISGLNAKFTSPGQTVTYTFYARNEGAYLAYLNYINFNNVEGESKNIKCEAQEGTSADLVEQACNGISISVKVGSDQPVSTNQSGISNHTLSAGNSETVVVTISYNTGSVLADGPFNITFGDIELIYSTIADYVPPVQETQIYKPQYYSWSSGNIGEDLPSDAKENVSEIDTKGYPYYLGLDVDSNNQVTAAYACFRRNGTEYCLKGGDEGAAYETNKSVLEDAFQQDACSVDDDGSYCDADGLDASADSHGYVLANGDSTACGVNDDGSFECIG